MIWIIYLVLGIVFCGWFFNKYEPWEEGLGLTIFMLFICIFLWPLPLVEELTLMLW